jgi:hypothetical protein
MTLAQFKRALSKPKPPASLAPALAALWWAGKGEWDKAHGIVMNDDGRDAAWVHAYLHRVEGDFGNAGYWYRQARRAAASGSLEAEWDAIATALIDKETRTP